MGNILVFLSIEQGYLTKSSLISIEVARKIQKIWSKEKIIGIALGAGSNNALQQVGQYGVSKAFFSEKPIFEKYIANNFAPALISVAQEESCDTIIGVASSTGKDLFPHIALALKAGQASDIIGVNDDGSLRRPMFAGDVIADVELSTKNRVVTVRAAAFAPAMANASVEVSIKELSVEVPVNDSVEVLSYDLSKGGRPELGDAEIVVSGGRAMQSSENFEKYIFPLADSLGAAVGASRAAVDAGYAPNDWQVGQTGKVVAPKLYFAVGISGAIQHLAGMKDSKTIVAINKDGDAPIFEVASYGLVGDLFDIVPKLTEALKAARK